jgi:ABC-2 type transport system permease protein
LWPILTLLLESVVFAAIALMLNTARDLGQGFIPAKPGRSEASFALRSPLGLAFRLLRNTMVAWLVTIFLLGASYGSVLGDFDDFINTSEFYQMMIGVNPNFSLVEMFATMVSSMMALVSVIPLIAAASKPWGEEKDNRAEHMLARVVSRWRYLSGYVVITYVFSVCLQLATPFGLYLSSMAVLAEPLPLDILLKSNLAYLPALWVIIGLTVLLAGLLPKVSGFIWVFYGYTFFVTFIGRALVIPDVFKAFTPFTYIPQYPIDDITAAPMVIMTVIAAVLTTAGFIFYRRRDVITAA